MAFLAAGEITKIALERKLVKATGKTPENTMASALYTDVRKRGSNSPFFKCVSRPYVSTYLLFSCTCRNCTWHVTPIARLYQQRFLAGRRRDCLG
jgi:hypothetical protein